MDIRVGKVTHYFNHLSVAVLELTEELKVGEAIHILGRVTDFDQHVGSLEIEHHKVQLAGPGSAVAGCRLRGVLAGSPRRGPTGGERPPVF